MRDEFDKPVDKDNIGVMKRDKLKFFNGWDDDLLPLWITEIQPWKMPLFNGWKKGKSGSLKRNVYAILQGLFPHKVSLFKQGALK